MYRSGDSVFRLSLVGIAFILICFLLIMFSRMYTDADVARTEALARLSQRQQEAPQPLALRAIESAKQELQAQLSEVGADPDKVIRDLLDKANLESELATEKKRVQELGAALMGLTEARKILTLASRTPILDGASAEELVSALELRTRLEQELGTTETRLASNEIASRALAALNFKRNIETLVETELGLPFVPGQEPAWGRWLVADSQSFKSVLNNTGAENNQRAANAEDATLRAQLNFLRARLDNNVAPPCWFDRTGRPQPLLTIELQRSENVLVKPAWPPQRKASALAIPGIEQLLPRKQQQAQMPYSTFKEHASAIAQRTNQQWCRYSVQVTDNLRNGRRSEKVHQELEVFFHLVPLSN